MTAPTTTEITMLPIARIAECPFNTRLLWGDMAGLADSIRAQGIIEPVIARTTGPIAWELAIGHRRLRAALQAGLVEIPAIVRELTDAEVSELLAIENLQRADSHPLEEAAAFGRMRDTDRVPVEEIASRTGKSKAYVYGRLKLLDLCGEAREEFLAGRLAAALALAVARVPAALQARAAKEIIAGRFPGDAPMSVRAGMDHLRARYMLVLDSAPFDTKSATLTAAGACPACPKRSGNQRDLFAEMDGTEKNLCTDPDCYAAKKDAAWKLTTEKAAAAGATVLSGKEAKKVLPGGAAAGEYLDLATACPGDAKGRTWGQVLGRKLDAPETVVRDARGEVHRLVPVVDAEKAAKAAGVKLEKPGTGAGGGAMPDWMADEEKRAAASKLRLAAMDRAMTEFVEAVGREKDRKRVLRMIASVMSPMVPDAAAARRGIAEDAEPAVVIDYIDALPESGLLAFVAEAAVSDQAFRLWNGYDKAALALLDSWGVDMKAIEKTVAKELAAADKAAAEKAAPVDEAAVRPGRKGGKAAGKG